MMATAQYTMRIFALSRIPHVCVCVYESMYLMLLVCVFLYKEFIHMKACAFCLKTNQTDHKILVIAPRAKKKHGERDTT